MPHQKRFGQLPPHYRFALNRHADYRVSRCNSLTYPRKFASLIHVEPDELRVLGQTCKYCSKCECIIAHQDELETDLAGHFERARSGWADVHAVAALAHAWALAFLQAITKTANHPDRNGAP